MYYFFDNIEQVKHFVGGGANLSVELASIEVALYAAYHTHVLPFIGEAQWQALQTVAGHATVPTNWRTAPPTPPTGWNTDEDDFSAEQKVLLQYLRRPMAMLAMYEYTKVNAIQVTEAGNMRIEGENSKTAYKYQETQYRDFYLEQGYDAIETMLEYLHASATDYPLWADDTPAAEHQELLLNTAKLMRRHYGHYISRHIYQGLRSIIADVERFALLSTLGQAQYDELLTAKNAGSLSAPQRQLVDMLLASTANHAIREALRRNIVQVGTSGVTQSERLEPQAYERVGSAAANVIAMPAHYHREWASLHGSRALAFLNANISDFPLYEAHVAALAQAAADAEAAANSQSLTVTVVPRRGIERF